MNSAETDTKYSLNSANHYMCKPRSFEGLVATIEKVLSKNISQHLNRRVNCIAAFDKNA